MTIQCNIDIQTQTFYSKFWPKYIPIVKETKKYINTLINERHRYEHVLDAGCGSGVCSIVLSKQAEKVTAIDLSTDCITVAKELAAKENIKNISFAQEDLQYIQMPENTFDLIWCWGVVMMTPNPRLVMENLFKVLKPGGEIYLGLYLKTFLSPVHQFLRHFFRLLFNKGRRKKFVLDLFTKLTQLIILIRGYENNLRADNVSIQAQVEDWFYPPYKTFYYPQEIVELMTLHGIKGELVQHQVGRMRSATIFVVKGVKKL